KEAAIEAGQAAIAVFPDRCVGLVPASTVFTHLYVGDDPARVREAVRPSAEETASFLGIAPDEAPMAAGTAKEAAEHVRALWAAGAGTVVLRPIGDDPLTHVGRILVALRDR
ncbi:hypothetical protein ACWEOJ_20350, partial [Streptosporangium sandarakinum]